MDSKPTVLVASISGDLGSKIAKAISDKGVMNDKGLVRSQHIDLFQRSPLGRCS